MCRAVLAIDKRFSNVEPRHPRGGPDGGRDLQATFRQAQVAFGAVGFVNGANDSHEQKRRVEDKFVQDCRKALEADDKPAVFVFFTNLNLTIGETDALIGKAKEAGFVHAEIFDRERIRIALDDADGFSIRFQFLGLHLSEPEQASFFARWGDEIQSVISTGFQRVERTLERIMFLQEASEVMSSIILTFELDRSYTAEEIGHFRAFCRLQLVEPRHEIFGILFGSSDRPGRMKASNDDDFIGQPAGIRHGIGTGQWEWHVNFDKTKETAGADEQNERFESVGGGSSIGMQNVEFLAIRYDHDFGFFRFQPRISLRDIDGCWFMPMLNKSLADKIKVIHIFSNGYKLQELPRSEFSVDMTSFHPDIPARFTDEELSDPWVRFRPANGSSTFGMSFSSQTPKRLFLSRETPNSLAGRSTRKLTTE